MVGVNDWGLIHYYCTPPSLADASRENDLPIKLLCDFVMDVKLKADGVLASDSLLTDKPIRLGATSSGFWPEQLLA